MSKRGMTLVAALALLGAACGARVPPYLGTGGAGTRTVGSTLANGAPVAPGATVPGGATATTAAAPSGVGGGGSIPGAIGQQTGGGGPAPAASPTVLTPENFPFDPSAQAALCASSSDNAASGPGVTPTSVTVGNVSGLTGVLTNNFNQAPEAVQALFAAVDAAGGICGRQLKVSVEDDGQDATKDAADISDLIPRVIAFVGSTSDADNGGVPEMQAAGTPDLGPAISANRGQSPMYLSPAGATQYVKNGHVFLYNSLDNGLKAANDFPTRIATLAYSIPISQDAAEEFSNAFVQSGSVACYSDYSVSPAQPTLDQDVLQMKSKSCDGVYTTMDVSGNAKLLQAMQRQNYTPKFVSTTFDGYTPAQISVSGESAAQGLQVDLPFIPFNEHNPIIDEYLSQLATYEPGKQPSGFGFEAWAGGEMFIYALLKSGRNPTRADLVTALTAIDTWDTGGATAPITPRLRLPSGPCLVDTAVKGNDFFRVWPSSGFYCNGTLVDVGAAKS